MILTNVCPIYCLSIVPYTDYGHPMKPCFIEIPNFWSWADKFWGIWVFGQFISTHFVTVSPFSMFSINQQLFLQKTKPSYPNIWDWYFNLGHRVSVVRVPYHAWTGLFSYTIKTK